MIEKWGLIYECWSMGSYPWDSIVSGWPVSGLKARS
jgi:hypothetical protein